MTGLATSVTRMPRARSPRDFARGRCEAEDVERAVARRMFLQCQALRFSRLAGFGRRPRSGESGMLWNEGSECTASSTEWSDARALIGVCRPRPTIVERETPSLLHLVEPGKKNVVRVSRASCVEWSDARESVFMVCGRRPRRVLKLRSRKTDAVRKLSIHHSPLLFTSQKHVCSDTGAAHFSR